jgi:hypothetical protein
MSGVNHGLTSLVDSDVDRELDSSPAIAEMQFCTAGERTSRYRARRNGAGFVASTNRNGLSFGRFYAIAEIASP